VKTLGVDCLKILVDGFDRLPRAFVVEVQGMLLGLVGKREVVD
jgi:hypothetical protein